MHRADSDFGPLEPVKHLPRTIRHVFNTCVVIGGLVGGGVSIGYFLGVQQQKQDSLAEIARLQVAYGLRLERAADSVTTAAKVTSSAAEAVGEAADQVGAAAKTATTAAITAKAAAKASAVPPPAPAPAAAVNNTIKRANEKLQGGRP